MLFDSLVLYKDSSLTKLSLFFACTWIFIIPTLSFYAIFLFLKLKSWPAKTCFLAILCFYTFLFFIFFPGMLGFDDPFFIQDAFKGIASSWQSFSYSVILSSGFLLLSGFGLTPILTVILFFLTLLRILEKIESLQLTKGVLFAALISLFLLSLHPINQFYLLFHSRDSLFSSLLVFISVSVLTLNHPKKIWIFFMVILLGLLADIRQDGLIFLILMPLIAFFKKKLSFRSSFIWLSLTLLFSFFINLSYHSFSANYSAFQDSYVFQNYIQPISYILYKNSSLLSDEEKKDFDAVLNFDDVVSHKVEPWFLAFDGLRQNHSASPEDFTKMRRLSNKLIFNHFYTFLEGRSIFLYHLITGERSLVFYETFQKEENFKDLKTTLSSKLNKNYAYGPFATEYLKTLFSFESPRENPLFYFVGSLIFPFLFFVYLVLTKNEGALISGCAILIFARLAVIFLTAPLSYFKYVYFMFLFFTFCFPVWLGKKEAV